jgi:endoglucanase
MHEFRRTSWLIWLGVLAGCQTGAPPPATAPPAPPTDAKVAPAVIADAPLRLNDAEYFERPGLDVMAFSDFYPEGHQGGVSIIQNGIRTAANGDLRLEPAPGQWQPVPKLKERHVNRDAQTITAHLGFPNPELDRKGFNPIVYPDLRLDYTVRVEPDQAGFRVVVDLDEPLPDAWVGRVGFNLELFPGEYFGKSYYMDGVAGTFPRQLNGPVHRDAQSRVQSAVFARGQHLTVAPAARDVQLSIEALSGGPLQLLDGRAEHNNGWFIVRAELPRGVTTRALEWKVNPVARRGWMYTPVVHLSQVGYHPEQSKVAVIELDRRDQGAAEAVLYHVGPKGEREAALRSSPVEWGDFLRYHYRTFDFTEITAPGVYLVQYGDQKSNIFRIGRDVYARHVWQPTLEYFLPVQMCHMRVNDRYRVWHDHCHEDDARMAPVNLNHFDGYVQGSSTLTKYKSGQPVPGLNAGGWHDAGDYDLRVESQVRTVRILSQIYEEFGVDYDATTIDQGRQVVEMHRPDGKPDVLQQIEHGVLTLLGGYASLGRMYRGIISSTNRQYVLLGDATAMTDHRRYSGRGNQTRKPSGAGLLPALSGVGEEFPKLRLEPGRPSRGSIPDDRWVFTEINPARELEVAAGLAAAARVLGQYNPGLSRRCLRAAKALYQENRDTQQRNAVSRRVEALVELALATNDDTYVKELVDRLPEVVDTIEWSGWALGRVMPRIKDEKFVSQVNEAISKLHEKIEAEGQATPFGVPYTPKIWGAGWGVQAFGVPQYFLHRGWPEIFDVTYLLNALNFVLGNHPGSNTASFASGVGANSLTVAYGVNRADWSYIPGGVGSGTALIRPDFPELKTWPFFWQQSEYVVGGGGTHFMFLALAAHQVLEGGAQTNPPGQPR